MNNKFLKIDITVVPTVFHQVISAKELIKLGHSIKEALDMVGISKSTFYKYKDKVFIVTEETE